MNAKLCKRIRRAARLIARGANLPERAYAIDEFHSCIVVHPMSERGVYRAMKAQAREHRLPVDSREVDRGRVSSP